MHKDELLRYLLWHGITDDGGAPGENVGVHGVADGMAQQEWGDEERGGEPGGKAQLYCHMCETRAVIHITSVGLPKGLPKVGKVMVLESVRKKLTVVENLSALLQWGVYDANEKVVTTRWSGGYGCLLEWLWCMVRDRERILSCRVPRWNQETEIEHQCTGVTDNGGSSKGLGEEVAYGILIVDNETSVTVLNTGRACNSFLVGCLRELEFVAAKCEFEMKAVHIPGVEKPNLRCLEPVGPRWRTQATVQRGHRRTRP